MKPLGLALSTNYDFWLEVYYGIERWQWTVEYLSNLVQEGGIWLTTFKVYNIAYAGPPRGGYFPGPPNFYRAPKLLRGPQTFMGPHAPVGPVCFMLMGGCADAQLLRFPAYDLEIALVLTTCCRNIEALIDTRTLKKCCTLVVHKKYRIGGLI